MPRAWELLLPALALLLTPATADDNRGSLASSDHECGPQGKYDPGSAYEANLRRLVATVTADVNTSRCNCSSGRVAGDLPDQVSASAFCGPSYFGANASSDCSACVTLGFREALRLCPYHRQAAVVVGGGTCTVSFRKVGGVAVDFEDDVDFTTIPDGIVAVEPLLLLDSAQGHLDRDLLFMLLFQATGIFCVVLMLLLGWRHNFIS